MTRASDDLVGAYLRRFSTEVSSIHWDAIEDSLSVAEPILRAASEPELLTALFARVFATPELMSGCERFNLFSKVLLHRDPASRCKLRLHLFEEPVAEAHNHRASFAALVVRGCYTHALFGGEDASTAIAAGNLGRPLFVQQQLPGTCYVIDHAMVHSTIANEATVSLMLQAPAARETFNIIDLKTRQVRRRSGGERSDGPQEAGERRLTTPDLVEVRNHLVALDVINAPGGPTPAANSRPTRQLVGSDMSAWNT